MKAKYEPNYFLREFGDPNDVHFNQWEAQNVLVTALQSLGAIRPTKAVRTVDVVVAMRDSGFELRKPGPNEDENLDLIAELGSWLEWSCERGTQPFASLGHPADATWLKWDTREWFINLTPAKDTGR